MPFPLVLSCSLSVHAAQSPDHGETYASTASFLLRLLVDDRHVCLVAVAKPIPEPAAPLPDLSSSVARPNDGDVGSGAVSPASLPSVGGVDGLKSLHLTTDEKQGEEQDGGSASGGSSLLSSSPGLGERGATPTSSLFSAGVAQSGGMGGGVAPTAPHARMINPRAPDGRINNTPATSVFSDIFAERGAAVGKSTLSELPGPTDVSSAPVKKVLSIPPARAAPGETETILGVVSAQLSVVTAASEDHLFPAADKEEASALIEIHLLTLATAPEERGQGLGAKLLSALHGECMVKARHMAMRLRKPIAGLRKIPSVPPLSPKFIDEAPLPTVLATSNSSGGGGAGGMAERSPYLKALTSQPTLSDLRDPAAKTGKFLARTFLEVHPSNLHALALYRAHGFSAPHDDAKALKRGFYRGDPRIATAERTKRGGTDAWILHRFDGPLPL